MKFSKRIWKWIKRRKKTEINLLTTAVEAIKIEKHDQDIQKDRRSELKKVDLANFNIHNKFKYKTGIAMIKEKNRFIRVPVIPKCTFDNEQEDGDTTYRQWMK